MANALDKNPELITSEHAVLIPPVPAATSIMAYVEAVATVIGSCHIHSVYEDQECIKMYLNDKKFVDFLVNTGISVLGRRVNVDYAIPRADKVTLKNIDPIIPDSILMRFLCYYGTPVSTIIHEKIATNLEYSHIECGTRKIYMNLSKDKKPPSKVSIQYQDVSYRFEMSVERHDKEVMDIDSSTTEEGNEDEAADEMQEVESIETGKPNINELCLDEEMPKKSRSRNSKPSTTKQIAPHSRGTNKENSITYAARKIKSRAAKDWYKTKVINIKSRGIKKIGNKVLNTNKGRKRSGRGGISKGSRGKGSKGSVTTSTPVQQNIFAPGEEGADVSLSKEISPVPEVLPVDKRRVPNITQYPFTTEEIKKLLFQTRFCRTPLHVVTEFLEKKNASDAMDDLLKQLLEYHNTVKVQNLRIRIRRLVKTLKSSAAEKNLV